MTYGFVVQFAVRVDVRANVGDLVSVFESRSDWVDRGFGIRRAGARSASFRSCGWLWL